MPREQTIKRSELVAIVERAAEGITASSRELYLSVARETDAVAVGWFHCDGSHCPARQANRTNRAFQTRFDELMYEHFGLSFTKEAGSAISVAVIDEALSASGGESA